MIGTVCAEDVQNALLYVPFMSDRLFKDRLRYGMESTSIPNETDYDTKWIFAYTKVKKVLESGPIRSIYAC